MLGVTAGARLRSKVLRWSVLLLGFWPRRRATEDRVNTYEYELEKEADMQDIHQTSSKFGTMRFGWSVMTAAQWSFDHIFTRHIARHIEVPLYQNEHAPHLLAVFNHAGFVLPLQSKGWVIPWRRWLRERSVP